MAYHSESSVPFKAIASIVVIAILAIAVFGTFDLETVGGSEIGVRETMSGVDTNSLGRGLVL